MADSILIVDDEPSVVLSFASLLDDEGYRTQVAGSAEDAAKLVEHTLFDLILLDIQLPGQSGLAWLEQLKNRQYPAEVLVISGEADIPMALDAIKLGAADFLEKPVEPEELLDSVSKALNLGQVNRQRSDMAALLEEHSPLIGKSPVMQKLKKQIDIVAAADTGVLITGENGTGKELIATRIHLASPRRDRPLIKVNCPGIPETLFESELFGHVKGAFTGAVKDFPGKFAMADGGTIFLDEIGDLPVSCQAKLLRVLETSEIETLGSEKRRTVDVRVVCATNQNLAKLIREGKFREDLYYRISVFPVEAPPLSSRTEDIPLLVGEFLRRFDPDGRTKLSSEALALVASMSFPGNVRQLKNLIERLTILYAGKTISPADIQPIAGETSRLTAAGADSGTLAERMQRFERTLIEEAFRQTGGNISRAARLLGVDRANLSRKVKELGLKV